MIANKANNALSLWPVDYYLVNKLYIEISSNKWSNANYNAVNKIILGNVNILI